MARHLYISANQKYPKKSFFDKHCWAIAGMAAILITFVIGLIALIISLQLTSKFTSNNKNNAIQTGMNVDAIGHFNTDTEYRINNYEVISNDEHPLSQKKTIRLGNALDDSLSLTYKDRIFFESHKHKNLAVNIESNVDAIMDSNEFYIQPELILLNGLYLQSDEQYNKFSKKVNDTNILEKFKDLEVESTTYNSNEDKFTKKISVSSLEKIFPELIKNKTIRTISGFNSYENIKVIDVEGMLTNIIIAIKELENKISQINTN